MAADGAHPLPTVLAVLGRGLVDPDEPALRADDAGVTRGDGCFEGCRVVVDGSGTADVAKLDAHLARMSRSAARLEIDFDAAAWRELITLAAAAWPQPGEAALKAVLTRGAGDRPTGFVWVTELGADIPRQRREGIRVVTLSRGMPVAAFSDAPWLLGGVKTLSYAVNMAAAREAQRRGADDVLFVSADDPGYVLEAPTASAVWATGRTLVTTPPDATGILAGTTQALLFDAAAAAGWRTDCRLATVAELHEADVLWLVSSTRGPVDVVDLDGTARRRVPEIDAEIRRLAGFAVPGS